MKKTSQKLPIRSAPLAIDSHGAGWRPVLRDEESYPFSLATTKKGAYYEDEIIRGNMFDRIDCLWDGQYSSWPK
jgi:hypothetical protein